MTRGFFRIIETTFLAAIETDIRDIKGPLGFPSRAGVLFSIAAILIGIFIIAQLASLIRKKIAQKKLKPQLPYEIAYEALEALNKKNYIEDGKIKEYFTELSFIIRNYLEKRFNLRAPEMTTQEFLLSVKDNSKLTKEHKRLLKEFLSRSDLVKFAKYGPTQTEIDSSFDSAKKLVDETKQEPEKKEKESR